MEKWRRPSYVPDLVFGNPRCGGFSGLGSNTASSKARGASCRQSIDAEQLCRWGVKLGAPFVVFESVQNILNPSNRGFVDRMIREVFAPKGYRIAHVKHNAYSFRSPQFRKRYFFVAYKRDFIFNIKKFKVRDEPTTVRDIFEQLPDVSNPPADYLSRRDTKYGPDVRYRLSDDAEGVLAYIPPGQTLNNLHHEKGPRFFDEIGLPNLAERSRRARSEIPFGVANTTLVRLHWDRGCMTLAGSSGLIIHPDHDRSLTVREIAALMGWPPNVIPTGQDPAGQIAKGIVPACGRWIAKSVAMSLRGEFDDDVETHWDRKNRKFVDVEADGKEEKFIDVTWACPEKVERLFDPFIKRKKILVKRRK
jgi:site-specific DNA-cytosine methylase